MNIKKSIWTVVILVIVALLIWGVIENRPLGSTLPGAGVGRVMSVEDYVKQNISELSPRDEVLGGKFMVTDIEAEDRKGVVSYEDGHNAFTADFTYSEDADKGIDITSFVVRE